MIESTSQFDPRLVGRWKTFSRLTGVVSSLVGGLVLIGWIFDLTVFKSFYGEITMKTNTALCLMLAGISLWVLAGEKSSAQKRQFGQLCAAVAGLIGALTLSQHVIGWDLGIDQLLFNEEPGALATASPNRMGPNASTSFTLLGIALQFLYRSSLRRVVWAQILAGIVFLIAMLPIGGYVYGAETLYIVARYTGIAPHTAVVLAGLSLGLFAARPDEGVVAVITTRRVGGLMARRLFIMAMAVPFLLGWMLTAAERAGLYDPGFGRSVLIISIMVIFALVIWRNAAKLNQLESERLVAVNIAQRTEAHFEAVLRQLPAAVSIAEAPSGRIVFRNDRVEAILGHQPFPTESLADFAKAQCLRADGSVYQAEEYPLARSLLVGEVVVAEEIVYPRNDGTRAIIAVSSAPLRDGAGKIVAGIATAIDITQRKQAEKEREDLLAREQKARTQAEEANRLKDEFLATVSHELRAPLNAILGWAKLLRSGQLDRERSEQAIATIERNARSQAQLIEDLLDVSRIITGKLRLEVGPVDLLAVIDAALETIRPAAEAKAVRLQAILDPSAGSVLGDAGRLQQIVWNLLSNAVKFTPGGGRVQVRLERLQSYVEIAVTDTGQGIGAGFLPYVFDRFRQADASSTRTHGGLGLGLAIVRHLVELHGGEVTVDSPGKKQGATFTVRLPRWVHKTEINERRVHPLARSSGAPEAEGPPIFGGVRVLIVDDEPDTLDLLKIIFEQCGAEVKAASSSARGIEEMKAWKPAIIVSDIGMPGEDGYAFIEKVRAFESESGGWTPAIALTAYARSEDQIRALAAGYQTHVAKPVEPMELTLVVASLLGKEQEKPT